MLSSSRLSKRVLLHVVIFLLGTAALYVCDAAAQRRQRSTGQANCQLEAGGESTVLAVAGPQTLRLADGRFVRLSEILVPTPTSSAQGFDPSLAAIAYLRAVALGRKVEVKFGGAQRDRYGVYIAHVYVAGDPPAWLQEGLVSAGYAKVFPQADNHSCSERLASFEANARDEKRGHWGLALFKVLRARDSRSITNLIQTYQVVEGKVDHVTESGGRMTIHFSAAGQHYGFTATIEPAVKKKLAANKAAKIGQDFSSAFADGSTENEGRPYPSPNPNKSSSCPGTRSIMPKSKTRNELCD
jgi:endonuclease YncB( thermonuclease family)